MTSVKVAGLLFVTTIIQAQQPVAPQISATPLTSEQVAVYRSFLADYNSGTRTALDVANVTGPFEPDSDPMISDEKTGRDSCLAAFPPHIHAAQVHLLPAEFASAHIRLVDPAQHKLADPGDNIHSPKDVDAAVEEGFAHGLMTLSEVVFDSRHSLAAFSYSFVCGRLCGNGGTVIYALSNGRWKRTARRCSSWIS